MDTGAQFSTTRSFEAKRVIPELLGGRITRGFLFTFKNVRREIILEDARREYFDFRLLRLLHRFVLVRRLYLDKTSREGEADLPIQLELV